MSNIAPLRSGASSLLPIYPTSFDDVVRFARMSIIGGMIKPITKGYGDSAETEGNNALEARATMVILQGMELGLPPMQSVQLLAMINGRITAHSEAVPGLLLSKGFKIKQSWSGTEMQDDWTAICELARPDGGVFVGTFSVKDAKQANLWDQREKIKKKRKDKSEYEVDNDSAWKRYPKRMLWARALGFAAKDGGSDAMKGLMVREEMDDFIRSELARDITPDADAIRVSKPLALELPDIPDEAPAADDIADVKDAISGAINTDMLAHIRESQYPDFDWDRVATEYDAKFDELKARGA